SSHISDRRRKVGQVAARCRGKSRRATYSQSGPPMRQTTNEIRLQACLLILFTCSLLAGLLGLFISAFPVFPVPQSLLLSGEGAIGVLVGGVALMAVFADWRRVRWAAGVVLAALGLYSIGHNLLAGVQDNGLSLLSGNARLETVPSLALLLTAGVDRKSVV